MSTYHRVYPGIWDEPWDDDARYVAFYLLTCRHRRLEGVYRLPWAYVLADLDWSEDRLVAAWGRLERHGFIEYDRAVGVVWIVKAMVRQPPENPNQRKSVIRAVNDLPDCEVVNRFRTVAATVHEQFAEGFSECFGHSLALTPTPTPTSLSSKLDVPDDDEPVPAARDVREVFEAWQAATGKQRAVLDAKRIRRIKQALKSHDQATVIDAVRGWRHSAWHRGENENGKPYNDLDLLLRDAGKIEHFAGLEQDHQRTAGQAIDLDAYVARRNAEQQSLGDGAA